jgi:hypothetical protein
MKDVLFQKEHPKEHPKVHPSFITLYIIIQYLLIYYIELLKMIFPSYTRGKIGFLRRKLYALDL